MTEQSKKELQSALDMFYTACIKDGDSPDDAAGHISNIASDKVQEIYDANPI